MMWIRRKVQRGTGTGRKIGFPTINFNIGRFGDHYAEGIYRCIVQLKKKTFSGALYFGPTMHHQKVLEIHVLGLKEKLYGQWVSFQVGKKIRKPKKITSLTELEKAIAKDVDQVSQ